MLASRTKAGRDLPEYFLVYFLLIDLLGYQNIGRWEKVAWAVPIRYRDRLYSVEHRKSGVGVFAPTHDPQARMSGTPSEQAESDACEIAKAITRAIDIASPYFEWRAKRAASTSDLNVTNDSSGLFERYAYFRDRSRALKEKAEQVSAERRANKEFGGINPVYVLQREAEWDAQSAIDAFFSWTEHVFIHLAILQGRLSTGDEVASLAAADWKAKFKAAMDLPNEETKRHYDALLNLRAQIRNFMAHGAFGKRGEAFHFHSGAGAVPVLLTQRQRHPYALTGRPGFDEDDAIAAIEAFVEHLWSGPRAPAKIHVFSSLPTILTDVIDGKYLQAMKSEQDMKAYVDHLALLTDAAANMEL